MLKDRIGTGQAVAQIRESMSSRSTRATGVGLMYTPVREQVWINQGFQEQLVIFQIDQYDPHPEHGAYLGWRIKVAAAIASMQVDAAGQ